MCDSLKIDLINSDEEEPKVKIRKQSKEKLVPKKIKPKIKTIRKSSFGQVKLKIYETNYKIWIARKNRKIQEFFKPIKVIFFYMNQKFLRNLLLFKNLLLNFLLSIKNSFLIII